MENKHLYPYVVPDMEKWPIYRLSQDREEFVKEVAAFTRDRILESEKGKLSEALAKVIYLERIRTKENPWKVDPPHETTFWNRLRRTLLKESLDKEPEAALATNKEILEEIIKRYSNEIAGNFQIGLYKFARRFLTGFFNRLLSTATNRNLKRFYGPRHQLDERIKIQGEIETIRALATKGTLVVVPTHFSNLDSILVGWAIDNIGLPAFSYGAGLNLYNASLFAWFMNRLGAYKVDRRKKNMLYLETLKTFSNLSIQRGTHSLFFPGGTRERSGSIEKRLKLGLLGTVTEAQRENYAKGNEDKIFVVPVVISYNFVLEAPKLVDDFLKSTGKEMYLVGKREITVWRFLRFLWQLFSSSSEIQLSFGKPLDVLGNFVDNQGNSLDKTGNHLDLKEYFISQGKVTTDLQRDIEYTKTLSEVIVDRFHRENIVLPSHVAAYTAFNLIRSRNPNLDLFGLLRLPEEDCLLPFDSFKSAVEALIEVLKQYEKNGRLKLSEELHGDVKEVILNGIRNQGIYHPKKPLKLNAEGDLISENFRLLFYYHNRLEGYQLNKKLKWSEY